MRTIGGKIDLKPNSPKPPKDTELVISIYDASKFIGMCSNEPATLLGQIQMDTPETFPFDYKLEYNGRDFKMKPIHYYMIVRINEKNIGRTLYSNELGAKIAYMSEPLEHCDVVLTCHM